MTNATLCGEKTRTRWEVAATVWEEGSGGDRGSNRICHLPAITGFHVKFHEALSHTFSHSPQRVRVSVSFCDPS